MNTTIHEMTLANYKRSKTQQRRKRNMRRKIIKIVNGQSQKTIQGIQCPRESIDENYVVARVSEKRESMNIGTRNVA